MKILDKFQPQMFAATRIAVSFMFITYGLQNTFRVFGGPPEPMVSAPGVAIGITQLIGGGLVMIGYKTRWAALFCSGQMAVGYFAVHQPLALLPLENEGQVAALFCWAFFVIAAVQNWVWAVDKQYLGTETKA